MSGLFVVVADGAIGKQIARIARRISECDQQRRVVRRGDNDYPSDDVIASWGPLTVAAVLNDSNTPVALLNKQRAVRAVWIEDAFLRAANHPPLPGREQWREHDRDSHTVDGARLSSSSR